MAREPTDGLLLRDYLQQREDDRSEREKLDREARRRKDKRYKQKQGCIRLYLDIGLLEQFKNRTKEKGISQSGVLRSAIYDFVSRMD